MVKNVKFGLFFLLFSMVSMASFSQTWEEINHKMEIEYGQGNFNKALDFAFECLKIAKEQPSERDTLISQSLGNCGMLLSILGRLDEAKKFLSDGLEQTKKSYGVNHLEYGMHLSNNGNLYIRRNEFEIAIEYFEQAASVFERTLGKQHHLFQIAINNLGTTYSKIGLDEKAIELYEKALLDVSFDNPTGEKLKLQLLSNLANSLAGKGELEKALTIQTKIDQRLKSILGAEHINYLTFKQNLANTLILMGQYHSAIVAYKENLLAFEKVLGKTHPSYFMASSHLASAYFYSHQNNQALDLLLPLLEIQDLLIKKENVQNYCSILMTLGAIYGDMGKHDLALEVNTRNYKMLDSAFGSEHDIHSILINNIGTNYSGMKRFEDAIKFYQDAIQYTEKKYGEGHYTSGILYRNLSVAYFSFGENAKGENAMLKSLDIEILNQEKQMNVLTASEKELFFQTLEKKIEEARKYLFLNGKISPEMCAKLFDYELKLKGFLLENEIQLRAIIQNTPDTSVQREFNQFLILKNVVNKQDNLPIDNRRKDLNELRVKMDQIERRINQNLNISIAGEFKSNSWKKIQSEMKKNELAIEFINYVDYQDTSLVHYGALILGSSQKPMFVPIGTNYQYNAVFQSSRQSDYQFVYSAYGTNNNPTSTLYDLIWKPLEGYLKDINTIYFSPVGILNKISFSGLRDSEGIFINDVYELHQVISTSNIRQTNSKKIVSEDKVLLMGGIDYGSGKPGNDVWNALPSTQMEIDNIKKSFEKIGNRVISYSGVDASEKNFKVGCSNHTIIHLSTHGFFFQRDLSNSDFLNSGWKRMDSTFLALRGGNPYADFNFKQNKNPLMRSGLVLAGANEVWERDPNDEGEDGVLTASEISNLNLTNAKLVVLSACETGLGDIKGSEGVYGLQRGLKIAGAKKLIMSLWKVPDEETRIFMTEFYKGLCQGKEIPVAFRETQKLMQKKYDPYFWAAFVLVE